MTDFPYEPFNRYIFRPENSQLLYFSVYKLMTGPGYDPDDPIDVEKETKGVAIHSIVYENTGRSVDGKWIFRFRGGL